MGRLQKLNLAIIFISACLYRGSIDNDIFFLLNTGRYLVQNGFTAAEPFTIHQDLAYQIQQWLSSVVFWEVYEVGGYLALLALTALLYGMQICILYRVYLLVSEGNQRLSFTLAMLNVFLLSPFKSTRPTMFTLLFLFGVFFALEKYIRTNQWKWLSALPAASLLLVNFHSAMWPMLPLLTLPYLLDSWLGGRITGAEKESCGRLKLMLAAGLMLPAGLVNPYGWKGMVYTLKVYHPALSLIQEMQPLNINNLFGMVFFFTILICVLVFAMYRKGTLQLRYLLLMLGTGYMALSSVRSVHLLVVSLSIAMSQWLKRAGVFNRQRTADPDAAKKRIMNLIAVSVVLLVTSSENIKSRFGLEKIETPLLGAVAWLDEHVNPDEIVLYNGFFEGGYLEFRGYSAYIDPRAEIFLKNLNQKEDILVEYFDLFSGKIHYRQFMDKYRFTHLLIEKDDLLLQVYLPYDTDWAAVYEDEKFMIYQRKGI